MDGLQYSDPWAPSEKELVALRTGKGNDVWFELVKRLAPFVIAKLRARNLEGADLDHVAQNVITRLWSKGWRYDPKRHLQPYLMKICDNCANDHYRKSAQQRTQVKKLREHVLHGDDEETEALKQKWREITLANMKKEKMRQEMQVILWHFDRDPKYAKSAGLELGMSATLVRQRHRRFMKLYGELITASLKTTMEPASVEVSHVQE